MISRMVRFQEFGSPDVLHIEKVELRDPGPGEVRIKVAAIGMNFAEAMWRQNQYMETPRLPSGLGYEAAGVIDKLGAGVADFRIGEKVATLAGHSQGDYPAYGDVVIMPASSLVRYPANLSDVEAASVWMAYLTGYFALLELAHLADAQTVLATAASSSTGLAAIQIAKAVGARVIATTRTSAKAAALREAGADVVVATGSEDLEARVLEETRGQGVDVAYDAVGGQQLAIMGRIIKPRGHLILYGVRSGEELKPPIWDLWLRAIHFHLYTLFNFTGSARLGLTRNEPAVQRAIAFVNRGFEQGLLKPKVDRTFEFSDVVAAHRYMEAGSQVGKIVMTV
jgi:NADPH:quinone reductase-like Zn-dependent oxidoreductase